VVAAKIASRGKIVSQNPKLFRSSFVFVPSVTICNCPLVFLELKLKYIDFALPNKWFAEMKLFDLASIKTGVLFNYVE